MDISRREFLRRAQLAGVGCSVVGFASEAANGSEAGPAPEGGTGVLVDLTKCNGCRQCEATCAKVNGFEVPTKEELLDESIFAAHRRPGPRSYTTVNRFPNPINESDGTPIYVKANCLHCLDPACMSACLVSAIKRQPNGAVLYNAGNCMGCRYCMVACPFQMPAYEYDNVLTPQVRRCTFCSNDGNPNKGGIPACVQVCPKQCLIYGERGELLRRAHGRISRHPDIYIDHIYGEHEAGGTSWLYLSGVPFDQIGFLKVQAAAPPRLTEAIQHGVFKHFVPPVAWCVALGIAMWMSRPASRAAPRAAPLDDENDVSSDAACEEEHGRQLEGAHL